MGRGAQPDGPSGSARGVFSIHLYCLRLHTRNVFYFLIKNKSRKGSLKEAVLLKNQNHFVFGSLLPILHHIFAKTSLGGIQMSGQYRQERAGGAGPISLCGPHPGSGGEGKPAWGSPPKAEAVPQHQLQSGCYVRRWCPTVVKK